MTAAPPGETRQYCPGDFASMTMFSAMTASTSFLPWRWISQANQYSGSVYVVFSDNDKNDGSDVALQYSRDRGATWSKLKFLNSRPGQDRGQWFPYVAVDKNTGRVSVVFL